ncbi:MAG: MBL fold metallo-hydrolase [Clostridia bacterium]|nr:MBL fold metallo-hydrolase [Clostridia bacterium]MDH7571977.1 MBL fold metallo-hydrolase [Clostridia bacterium]
MEIRWLGHACFEIKSARGLTILTDPFAREVGYPRIESRADVVTVSHQHFDHNAVALVPGKPRVVEEPGVHQVEGVTFRGISTFHDSAGGKQRGKNLVFVFAVDGVNVCHLGDLGHVLDARQVAEIGPVDVLMVPVGGYYTIDAAAAKEVVEALGPRIVLPMHYKTPVMPEASFPIAPVGDFTRFFERVVEKEVLEVDREHLPPGPEVVVLSYPQK